MSSVEVESPPPKLNRRGEISSGEIESPPRKLNRRGEMSSVDRGEAPCRCDRKSSIEMEPRTLYEIQLQEAREEAIDILNSKEPEEALSIFSQREKFCTNPCRCPPVFAVEDEMQQGHARSLIIKDEDDHQRQHSKHNKKQKETVVIKKSDLVDVAEDFHPPFTERRGSS